MAVFLKTQLESEHLLLVLWYKPLSCPLQILQQSPCWLAPALCLLCLKSPPGSLHSKKQMYLPQSIQCCIILCSVIFLFSSISFSLFHSVLTTFISFCSLNTIHQTYSAFGLVFAVLSAWNEFLQILTQLSLLSDFHFPPTLSEWRFLNTV